MKPSTLLPLIGALAIAGASPAMADHALPRDQVKAGVEPRIFDISKHHARMKRAVHEARRTVGVFIQAVQHPRPGEHDFAVKKPIRQGDVVEHLWLSNVWFAGNRFHGYVDNHPRKITGLKMGDRVSVNPSEISDWAFVENGRLVGGYTIKVLYSELSPADRKALEAEARFRIATHH